MRRVTQRGLEAIIRHEGIVLTPYRDVANLLTIGVGHLLTRSELSSGKIVIGLEAVKWKDGITREQAMKLLMKDLEPAERVVEQDDGRSLTDGQFDALVSFVFNVGVGAYLGSTLRRKLMAGELDEVPTQMLRWDRAGGLRVLGLTRRREAEAAMWRAK